MRIKIFFCYAREDEALLQGLEKQLRILRRQGLIDVWYDRDISAGADWEKEIDKNIDNAQIILLLISSDFMVSEYCYGVEMKRAMERHQRGEAMVIPVILRPTLWQGTLFGKLQALPKDGRPVSNWSDGDSAFYDIAVGIQHTIEDFLGLRDYPEHVARAISDCYFQLEEFPTALLGTPSAISLSDAQQLTSERGTIGYKRPFTKGIIQWSEHTGAHPLYGAIGYLYQQHHDIAKRLGFPLTHEHSATDSPQRTKGIFQRFEGTWDYPENIIIFPAQRCGATMYWSERYGAHPTWGGIGQYYESMGGTTSILGFPTSPEMEAASLSYSTTGYYQNFEGGAIFWCEKYGSVHVEGAIAIVYDKLNGTNGRLGFPKSPPNILDVDHPDIRIQEFEGGIICITQ